MDRTLASLFTISRADPGGQEEKVGFRDKLTLIPHFIHHTDQERSIGGDFEQVNAHEQNSAGLDLEYQFNDAQSLAVTLNPNYTDVEADIARQSINNPFTIFQPEKRRFFKATTEYYNTLIPAVYTRNIVQPKWGLSYIRDDVTDSSGIFWVEDDETELVMPDALGSEKVELLDDSSSGAFRYRYSRDKKSIGVVGTYRQGDDYRNSMLGIDGLMDFGPDDKLRYQVLFSDTLYPQRFADDLCEEDGCTETPPPEFCPLGDCSVNAAVLRTDYGNELRGHALQVRYKHDGPNALYWIGYEDIAPDFRADLGFQRRVDIRSLNMAYGKKWYLNTFVEDHGQSRIRGYLIGTHTRSHEYNDELETALGAWAEFRGSFQTVFRVGYRYRDRAVNRINQASLETGSNAPLFEENYWQWYFETAPWPHWTINLDGRIG